MGLFFFVLPFFRNDKKFIVYAAAIFIFSTIAIFSQLDPASFGSDFFSTFWIPGALDHGDIPKPGPTWNFFLFGVLLFVTICALIQKIKQNFKTSYGLIILGSFIGIGLSVASIIGKLPSLRYQTASNPFLLTTDPLTESIAEHAFTSLDISFFYSINLNDICRDRNMVNFSKQNQ